MESRRLVRRQVGSPIGSTHCVGRRRELEQTTWPRQCGNMLLLTNERCLEYAAPGHPERPERVRATVAALRRQFPDWRWSAEFAPAAAETLLLAHSERHLARLREPRDFDADTAFHPDIDGLARLATGAALAALDAALAGEPAWALMRPPGHHAERERAMGFCYLNHVAVAALEARRRGVARVAVWDFDAHHGNGTEAILSGVTGTLYVSVHQHPAYPGTGVRSEGNCRNFPVAPGTPPEAHMERLRESWRELLDFSPQLVLVSAGFDAYELDPITQMTLRMKDFHTLGTWLRETGAPVAAVLEGGYSDDLPLLVEAFGRGWSA